MIKNRIKTRCRHLSLILLVSILMQTFMFSGGNWGGVFAAQLTSVALSDLAGNVKTNNANIVSTTMNNSTYTTAPIAGSTYGWILANSSDTNTTIKYISPGYVSASNCGGNAVAFLNAPLYPDNNGEYAITAKVKFPTLGRGQFLFGTNTFRGGTPTDAWAFRLQSSSTYSIIRFYDNGTSSATNFIASGATLPANVVGSTAQDYSLKIKRSLDANGIYHLIFYLDDILIQDHAEGTTPDTASSSNFSPIYCGFRNYTTESLYLNSFTFERPENSPLSLTLSASSDNIPYSSKISGDASFTASVWDGVDGTGIKLVPKNIIWDILDAEHGDVSIGNDTSKVILSPSGVGNQTLLLSVKPTVGTSSIKVRASMGEISNTYTASLYKQVPVNVVFKEAPSSSVDNLDMVDIVRRYTADVIDQFGKVIVGAEVVWSVDGNPQGVSIDQTGKLTITPNANAFNVVVRATAKDADSSKHNLKFYLNDVLVRTYLEGDTPATSSASNTAPIYCGINNIMINTTTTFCLLNSFRFINPSNKKIEIEDLAGNVNVQDKVIVSANLKKSVVTTPKAAGSDYGWRLGNYISTSTSAASIQYSLNPWGYVKLIGSGNPVAFFNAPFSPNSNGEYTFVSTIKFPTLGGGAFIFGTNSFKSGMPTDAWGFRLEADNKYSIQRYYNNGTSGALEFIDNAQPLPTSLTASTGVNYNLKVSRSSDVSSTQVVKFNKIFTPVKYPNEAVYEFDFSAGIDDNTTRGFYITSSTDTGNAGSRLMDVGIWKDTLKINDITCGNINTNSNYHVKLAIKPSNKAYTNSVDGTYYPGRFSAYITGQFGSDADITTRKYEDYQLAAFGNINSTQMDLIKWNNFGDGDAMLENGYSQDLSSMLKVFNFSVKALTPVPINLCNIKYQDATGSDNIMPKGVTTPRAVTLQDANGGRIKSIFIDKNFTYNHATNGAKVVLSLYNENGNLEKVYPIIDLKNSTLNVQTPEEVVLPNDGYQIPNKSLTGYSLKAVIWNDMDKIQPLSKAEAFPKVIEQQTVNKKPTRQMEFLDRGLIAFKKVNSNGVSQGIYLGWRLLATDPKDLSFNIYRNGTKINSTPITGSTNYLHASGTTASKYSISAVFKGVEQPQTSQVTPNSTFYFDVPLDKPAGGTVVDWEDNTKTIEYSNTIGNCSVGDVDNDGQYEIFVKWNGLGKDNGQWGYTSEMLIDCYKLDGTKLWRINLGKNIRQGGHYNDIVVADFDGDGSAEMACKTADGTVDGLGNVIGDGTKDYRNGGGFILEGPEFLTVFNGKTGKAMDTVAYDPPRGTADKFQEVWGDTYGNRMDRYLACAAYLDGVHPSFVMCRGYYTRMALAAYDFKDGKIVQRWRFDTLDIGNEHYYGQGNHNLSVGDVDEDGFDEIIYGSSAFDHDGKGMYSTKLGHGDAMHLAVHDPDRPGLQVWQVHEADNNHGYELHDAKTGELIWYGRSAGDNGRGMAAHVDSEIRGSQMWSAATSVMFDNKGNAISADHPSFCFTTWWGKGLERYLLDGTKLDYWSSTSKSAGRAVTLYNYGVKTNSGTKANPPLQADIFGDWREEILLAANDDTFIRIFTTDEVTDYKFYTFMHNPGYRNGIAWQNVGYSQPPHTDFYIGQGMAPQPEQSVYYVNDVDAVKDAVGVYLGSNMVLSNNKYTSLDVISYAKDALVPMKFISDVYGATSNFNASDNALTITLGNQIVNMKMDSNIITVNGQQKILDVAPSIVNGRTMVPLKGLAENLGKTVLVDSRGLILVNDFSLEGKIDDASIVKIISKLKY